MSKLGPLHLDQSRVSKRTARVQPQPGRDTTGICPLRHRAFMGSEVFASFKLGVSQFTKFCAASCHCVAPCPCFASCNCCHGPFIVRSSQTCPPFTDFARLAHPSRCSRTTLLLIPGLCVCTAPLCSHRVSVYIGAAVPSPDPSQASSPSSCPRSVEYQSCKLAMLL